MHRLGFDQSAAPTDGVWLLDYRSGKLLGTVVDRDKGKINGWAEVDLTTEFNLAPRANVHFLMTTGQIAQGQAALYVAETSSGKFGVYTMGPRRTGRPASSSGGTTWSPSAPPRPSDAPLASSRSPSAAPLALSLPSAIISESYPPAPPPPPSHRTADRPMRCAFLILASLALLRAPSPFRRQDVLRRGAGAGEALGISADSQTGAARGSTEGLGDDAAGPVRPGEAGASGPGAGAAADRRTLIRRATFDLTGLPPEPADVEAFVKDPAPDAWEKVIDRLLASPRYGERWGRHWLDVARYADTKGYVFQEERRYPFAYTYRDYVVRAFNSDLPYDRFVIQQIAADRLPLGDDKRPLAALGFLTLGRHFLNSTPDIIDDRIDVVMRGLQGLTVGCARCHDHKFDPIPMRDYYSLYGVFASSVEPRDLPVLSTPDPTPAYLAYEKELKTLQQAVADFEQKNKAELQKRNRKFQEERRQLQNKVDKLKATHPGAPPQAMVLNDAPHPVEPVVFLRGNPNNRGPAVPRQFLEVLAGDVRRPFTDGSGRPELARAIASKDNPLTARVLVNRVWLHHFGQALVRTPGDFGLRGDAPTHPELLDYLSLAFMDDGWSMKKLHRLILGSATYQQSCTSLAPRGRGQGVGAEDVDNRLLSHQNRQRLDFEALRDSLLWASGRLDTSVGGAPVDITAAPFSHRRSVYGFIDRQNLPGLFRSFDFASPDTCTPQRHVTTVPQQALFLMNAPFVVEQAKALAARADVIGPSDTAKRVDALYRLLYGRAPDADELRMGQRFLASESAEKAMTTWERYCQVLLLANEFAFVD